MDAKPVERRLREAAASTDAREARAAQLLNRVGPPLPLNDAATARVAARLRERSATRRRAVPASLAWAAIAVALLCAVGAAAAIGPPVLARLIALLTHRSRHVAPRAPGLPVPAPAASAPPKLEPPAPTSARSPSREPPPHGKRAEIAAAKDSVAAPMSPLLADAKELAAALALRKQGDLDGEVAALQRFRAAHPQGALLREAMLAELDADLALGRRPEALALLDPLSTSNDEAPRAAELRVLRSELLARAGRCAEALPGFERATGSDALGERALFGRAHCHLALGQTEAGRKDFEQLIARYPKGSLAAEARRALAGGN